MQRWQPLAAAEPRRLAAHLSPIDTPVLSPPPISWGHQVLRVQKMVNNSPAEALDGRMTRSQAMYGAVDQCEVLPDVNGISELLQFSRCAAAFVPSSSTCHPAPACSATVPAA